MVLTTGKNLSGEVLWAKSQRISSNSYYFLSIYYVPDFVPSMFHVVTHGIFNTALPITSQNQSSQHYPKCCLSVKQRGTLPEQEEGLQSGWKWRHGKQRGTALDETREVERAHAEGLAHC